MEKRVKNVRQSNIELCRIISMCMIIAHHCVFHGGGVNMNICMNKWIALFIFPGGKMCFDTFIAISCWFLVSQNFKTERFFKMWLTVLFYSVGTMIVATYMGYKIALKEWLSGLFLITGSVQGYAATYLAFYLMLPLLSVVREKISREQNIYIIIVFTIFVFLSRFMTLFGTEQSAYCRLILFIYIYFIMLYVKNNPIKILDSPIIMFAIFLVSWGLVFLYYYGAVKYPGNMLWTYTGIFILDEGGISYFIGGLALFFFFKNITIRPIKLINLLGSTTFAVILIHDGHFFRFPVWNMLKTTEWWYSRYYFGYVCLCVFGIYIVCSVIELIRRQIIEKPLFGNKIIRRVCKKLDRIILAKTGDS